jgi:hypothetical protein
MRRAFALILLAAAAAAHADSVTNQILVSSTRATEGNPRSSVFSDVLNASFNAGDDWTLSAGASLTLQGRTPAATRGQFDQSSGAVTFFTVAADWSVTDSFTVGASVDISPKSTQFAGTTIPVVLPQPIGRATADAQVRSETSQLAAGVDVAWDSLGRSDLEWSFTGGVHFSHYDINQSIPQARVNGSALTMAEIEQGTANYCSANPQRATYCRELLGTVSGVPTPLDFERLSAGATATLHRDTDVSLFGDFYVYNQDPTGTFFGLAAAGRGPGLPIAPLRYLLRPDVLHRFGDFSARLWLEGGEYVSGTGGTTAGVGLKLQYRFTKAWRAWLTVSGQRDVDAGNNITRSGSLALGAGYRW